MRAAHIGGILLGVFTPTEAAAVAAGYGLLLGAFVSREFTWTALSTGTVMFIVAMANVYSYVLSRERLPELARDALLGLSADRYVVLALVIGALLGLGCFLSTTPRFSCRSRSWRPSSPDGLRPVHFSVLVTITLILGTLTPPVALSLYLASSLAGVAPERCFVALIPYLLTMLGILLLTVLCPGLIRWLPNLVMGGAGH
jgi:C4-dicarboxylate transporter DctM subunit